MDSMDGKLTVIKLTPIPCANTEQSRSCTVTGATKQQNHADDPSDSNLPGEKNSHVSSSAYSFILPRPAKTDVDSVRDKAIPPSPTTRNNNSQEVPSTVEKGNQSNRIGGKNKKENSKKHPKPIGTHVTEKPVPPKSQSNDCQTGGGEKENGSANTPRDEILSEAGDVQGSDSKSKRRRRTYTGEVKEVYHFTDSDVLMGRGNFVNKLPGNLRFRSVVNPFRIPYNNTKELTEKRKILYKAFQAVVEGGNQFLEVVEWSNRSRSMMDAKSISNATQTCTESEDSETSKLGVFRTVVLERALEKVAQALREPKWGHDNSKTPEKNVNRKENTKAVRKVSPPLDHDNIKTTGKNVNRKENTKAVRKVSPPLDHDNIKTTEKTVNRKENTKTIKKDSSPLAKETKVTSSLAKETKKVTSPLVKLSTTITEKKECSSSLAKENVQENESTAGQPDKASSCLPMPKIKHVLLLSSNDDAARDDNRKRKVEEISAGTEQQNPETQMNKGKKLKKQPGSQVEKRKKQTQKESKKLSTPQKEERPMALAELGERDVLFGRGHYVNRHSGNIRFRQVVLKHKPAYAKLPPSSKRPMAVEIFHQFEGRFWEVAPGGADPSALESCEPRFRRVEVARCVEKICQALREKYHYIDRKKPSQQEKSNAKKANINNNAKMLNPAKEKNQSSDDGAHQRDSTSSQDVNIENLLVGSRIAVYWPMDKTYYEAVVEDRELIKRSSKSSKETARERLALYNIRYLLDNEREWINLNEHKFKIIHTETTKHLKEDEKCSDPSPDKPKSTIESTDCEQNDKSSASSDQDQKSGDGKVFRIMKSGNTKRRTGRRSLFWMKNSNGNCDDQSKSSLQ